MKQTLRLYVMDNPDTEDVLFRVVEQSHRGNDFGYFGSFVSRNGVELISAINPDVEFENNNTDQLKLYVWGSCRQTDNNVLVCSKETYERLDFAVREFNAVDLNL